MRFAVGIALSLLSTSLCSAAEHASSISGTVRDAHGVPQMGAVIELVPTGQGNERVAVTGLDGRFVFAELFSGSYRLRARATLLRPASTRLLRVGTGVATVVNLTLTSVYDSTSWLPIERRSQNEADDDWMWTMRSAAGRPVLRAVGTVAGSRSESRSRDGAYQVRMELSSESGGFGTEGQWATLASGRQTGEGDHRLLGVVRVGGRGQAGEGQTLEAAASDVRDSSPWSRVVEFGTLERNPQVRLATRRRQQMLRFGGAETLVLGDLAEVQVGGMLTWEGEDARRPQSRPFARAKVELGGGWSGQTAFATDRVLQRSADADQLVGVGASGVWPGSRAAARTEHGRHVGAGVVHQGRSTAVRMTYFRDEFGKVPVVGFADRSGLEQLGDLGPAEIASGTFRIEASGYKSDGCDLAVTQNFSSESSVEVELESGVALSAPESASAAHANGPAHLRASRGASIGVVAKSRVRRSGTEMRASYTWQPSKLVTPVDPFHASGRPAYLALFVQQELPRWIGGPAAVLTLSGSNLLHEGMRTVSLPERNAAVVTQELPSMQASVGFTF